MYIKQVFKLKLKPDEEELLKKCETLLQDILHDFSGGYLGDIRYNDISFAAGVLRQLNTDKELY